MSDIGVKGARYIYAPAGQAGEHIGHREAARRGGHQLDGERQPVEVAAELADEAELGSTGGVAPAAAREEQPDRG